MNCPFETLGVSSTATTKEIKKAYRAMASKHHPDKEGGDTEKFQTIQDAYEKVKDGDYKSASYDFQPDTKWYQSKDKYSGRNGYREYYADRSESIVTYQVVMDASEMYNGAQFDSEQLGTFNVPKGVRNCDTMYVNNKKIEISFKSDSDYSYIVQADMLYRGISISNLAAMIGTHVTFEHLDGKKYKLKIPAGTKDAHTIDMPELGLYNRETGKRDKLKVYLEVHQMSIYDEETLDLLKKKGYYKDSYTTGK